MRRSNRRQQLQEPSKIAFTPSQRQGELKAICDGLIGSSSQKKIHRLILERLLPEGAGVPGPAVPAEEFHEILGAYPAKSGKPYKDPFRRFRELQGNEGVHGIIKHGNRFQLVSLALGPKKPYRKTIPKAKLQELASQQGWRCAICGRDIVAEGPNRFDPDHRIPRARGGSDDPANIQALCPACNNQKSSQCSNCELECRTCPWAFPEKYKIPHLKPELTERLTSLAQARRQDFDAVINELVEQALFRIKT